MVDFLAILALNNPSKSLYHFLLNKGILSYRSKFLLCFFFIYDFVTDLLQSVVLLPTCCGMWSCCLGMTVSNLGSKTYSIRQRHQIMVVNIL